MDTNLIQKTHSIHIIKKVTSIDFVEFVEENIKEFHA